MRTAMGKVAYSSYSDNLGTFEEKERYAEKTSAVSLERFFGGNMNPGKCIDYGGRIGEHTRRLADCTVVEIDESALAHMRRVGVKCMDTEDFRVAFPENSADLAFCSHVLEHLPNPLEALALIRGKLKEGGRLHVVVPHEGIRFSWCADQNMHLHTYSASNIVTTLTLAGFTVKEVGYRLGDRLRIFEKSEVLRNAIALLAQLLNPFLELFGMGIAVNIECITVKV